MIHALNDFYLTQKPVYLLWKGSNFILRNHEGAYQKPTVSIFDASFDHLVTYTNS